MTSLCFTCKHLIVVEYYHHNHSSTHPISKQANGENCTYGVNIAVDYVVNCSHYKEIEKEKDFE
jgi:hypothetical protein